LIVISFLSSYAVTKGTEGPIKSRVNRAVPRAQKLEEQCHEEESGGDDVKVREPR
jgi:hypothetical protein